MDGVSERGATSYRHHSEHLSVLRCPGIAVDGSLMASPTHLTGTVDGASVDETVNGAKLAPGRIQLIAERLFNLEVDDAGTGAAAGNIESGYFRAASGDYYCIGGGSFTRSDPSDPEAVSVMLTNFSRVECRELPVAGSIDACIADNWQTDRPEA